MPLRHPSRNTRSARRPTHAQDLPRAVIVTLVLAATVAIAALAGAGWQLSSARENVAVGSTPVKNRNSLTTGSIVFVPSSGDICRQSEIDNATWQIREVGEVPCQQALSAAAHKGEPIAGTRLAIIRDSFRKTTP